MGIWRAHGLQRHLVRQFKLSNDPRFIEKLRDVVRLHFDPPAHAIVLSVDEKSQKCERHAGEHEHCRICAQSCKRCADACQAALE